MIEFESAAGLIRAEPLFHSEEREVASGETFSIEWKAPNGIEPTKLRWVLVRSEDDD